MRLAGLVCSVALLAALLPGQEVTYLPYIQPGDAGPFGPADQMVVAWQTNESTANPAAYTIQYGTDPHLQHATEIHPSGRVVDNYLTADPTFASLVIPTAYGAHTDYYGLLSGLRFETRYYYRVSGPGLPAGGFTASFATRTRQDHYSFQIQGDEGYYPGIPKAQPTDPTRVADYEARIIHTMFNVDQLSFAGPAETPPAGFCAQHRRQRLHRGSRRQLSRRLVWDVE